MAEKDLNDAPSTRCRVPGAFEPLAAIDLCYDGPGVDFILDWRKRPDLPDSAVIGGRDYTDRGTTPGFSQGMMLLPYVLDWGDYVGAITRRHSHPTILKAWPSANDRTTALVLLARYVDKRDTCTPTVTAHLIAARPFVGYTWDPHGLLEWLELVELDPGCNGITQTTDLAAALASAQAWLTRAEQLWSHFTNETFPYTERDVLRIWYKDEPAAALP